MQTSRHCGPLMLALLGVNAAGPAGARGTGEPCPRSSDPELREVVQQAIVQAQCFADQVRLGGLVHA